MRVGVFTPFLSQLSLEDVLKKLKSSQYRHSRTGHRQLSGRSALQAVDARQRDRAERIQEEARRQRVHHQRAELPRQSAASRIRRAPSAYQEISRKTILLAEKLGVPVVIDFSGCPGDSDEREVSELGDLPLAAGVSRGAGVAVGEEVDSLLDRAREVRRGPRREGRDRDASGLCRVQPGDDAAAALDRRPVDRLQLRSEPHVLAGHRSDRRDPRAGRLRFSTCMPRTRRSTSATCR